jgi:hypothetical protein
VTTPIAQSSSATSTILPDARKRILARLIIAFSLTDVMGRAAALLVWNWERGIKAGARSK